MGWTVLWAGSGWDFFTPSCERDLQRVRCRISVRLPLAVDVG